MGSGYFARRANLGLARLGSFALAVLCCAVLGACGAVPREQATIMPIGAATGQPIGAMLFCTAHTEECAGDRQPEMRIVLTDEAWHALRTVQSEVNRQIEPRGPLMVAWDYARDAQGSCVQYALEKRRALLALGWPESALRLATATTREGAGHLVLIANTTAGDLVLDNLHRDVMPWQDLPYRWGAIQEDGSLRHWVIAAAPGGRDGAGNLVVTLAAPAAMPVIQSAEATRVQPDQISLLSR